MANLIQELGSGLAEKIFGSILMFGLVIIAVAVVGAILYFFVIYKKRFDIVVPIRSQRADGTFRIKNDLGAIIYSPKDKVKLLRLWSLKMEFPIPDYDVMQVSDKGDMIEMVRWGEEDFAFLLPPKIERGKVYKKNGEKYELVQQRYIPIETDVQFWGQKKKGLNRKIFDTEGILSKLLPFLPHILTGMISLFIIYILMDSLPTILSQLSSLIQELKELKGVPTTYE